MVFEVREQARVCLHMWVFRVIFFSKISTDMHTHSQMRDESLCSEFSPLCMYSTQATRKWHFLGVSHTRENESNNNNTPCMCKFMLDKWIESSKAFEKIYLSATALHMNTGTQEYTARQVNFGVIRPNRFGFSVVVSHTALKHYSTHTYANVMLCSACMQRCISQINVSHISFTFTCISYYAP